MMTGILDLLDQVDSTLAAVDVAEENKRRLRIRIQNARLTIQEIRRRIERVGQETKT